MWSGDARDLLDFPLPDPEPSYMGEGVIQKRGRCLVTGGVDTGKSIVSGHLAYSLITGQNAFGDERFFVREPVRVLYVDQEIGEWSMKNRLRIMEQNCDVKIPKDMLFIHSMDYKVVLHGKDAGREWETLLNRYQPQVVFYDNLFRGAETIDIVEKMGFITRNITKLIQKYNFSFVLAVHGTRSIEHRGLNKIYGGEKLGAWANTRMMLEPVVKWKNVKIEFSIQGAPPTDPINVKIDRDRMKITKRVEKI